MERIYYDTYENRIRVTVWADEAADGSIKIHKYTRGVYIDDIFGMDEDEVYATVSSRSVPQAMSAAHVSSLKDLFVFFDSFACSRNGYEQIRLWLDTNAVTYSEEIV